jgi:hypothetical protein
MESSEESPERPLIRKPKSTEEPSNVTKKQRTSRSAAKEARQKRKHAADLTLVDDETPKKKMKKTMAGESSSKKPKSGAGASKEKKGKEKLIASANAPAPNIHQAVSSLFINQASRELYEIDYQKRSIQFGRPIDFKFFSSIRVPFRQWFDKIGWLKAMQVKEPGYPALVKLFYANMSPGSSKFDIKSQVKGKDIALTVETLANILEINRENALEFTSTNSESFTFEGYSFLKAVRFLLEDPNFPATNKVNANDFPMTKRLMHHIVCTSIVQRAGSFEYAGSEDVFLTYAILKGFKIDLSKFILHKMTLFLYEKSSKKRDKTWLPFGMWLTKVFKHFEVSFDDEVIIPIETKRTYCASTLQLMHYVEIDGKWVRMVKPAPTPSKPSSSQPSSSLQLQDQVEEEEAFDALLEEQAPKSQSTMSEDQFSELKALVASLGDTCSTILGEVIALKDRVSTLEVKVDSSLGRMSSLETKVDNHLEDVEASSSSSSEEEDQDPAVIQCMNNVYRQLKSLNTEVPALTAQVSSLEKVTLGGKLDAIADNVKEIRLMVKDLDRISPSPSPLHSSPDRADNVLESTAQVLSTQAPSAPSIVPSLLETVAEITPVAPTDSTPAAPTPEVQAPPLLSSDPAEMHEVLIPASVPNALSPTAIVSNVVADLQDQAPSPATDEPTEDDLADMI